MGESTSSVHNTQYEVSLWTSKTFTELHLFLFLHQFLNVLKLMLTPQVVLNLFAPSKTIKNRL